MRADFDDSLAKLERKVSAAQIGVRFSNALCVVSLFLMLAGDSYYAGTRRIHDLSDWKTGLELFWFVISPMPLPISCCFVLRLFADTYPRFWLLLTCLCASVAEIIIYLATCVPPLVRWGSYLRENKGLLAPAELFSRSLEASGAKINHIMSLAPAFLDLVDVCLLAAVLWWGRKILEIKGECAGAPGAAGAGSTSQKGGRAKSSALSAALVVAPQDTLPDAPAAVREVRRASASETDAAAGPRGARRSAGPRSSEKAEEGLALSPWGAPEGPQRHAQRETLETSSNAGISEKPPTQEMPGPADGHRSEHSMFLDLPSHPRTPFAEEIPHSLASAILAAEANGVVRETSEC